MGIAILLLLLGIIPGIVYMLTHTGYDYFRPDCGHKIRSDLMRWELN